MNIYSLCHLFKIVSTNSHSFPFKIDNNISLTTDGTKRGRGGADDKTEGRKGKAGSIYVYQCTIKQVSVSFSNM